jgi:hypothetical protein
MKIYCGSSLVSKYFAEGRNLDANSFSYSILAQLAIKTPDQIRKHVDTTELKDKVANKCI